MAEPSWIQIDMPRLDGNLKLVREMVGEGTFVCAVVKADGYGLGAVSIARRLVDRGVNMLAVYNIAQATEIARSGVHVPILILMPVDELERQDVIYRTAVAGRLHLTAHSEAQLQQVENIGMKFGIKVPVHLEVDTGMSRTGMSVEEADRVIPTMSTHKYIQFAGLFTHASSADRDMVETERQYEAFMGLVKRHESILPNELIKHFSASHAMMRDKRFHMDMVRVGLSIFGYGATDIEEGPVLDKAKALEPIVQWWTRVVHVQHVPKGTKVGYGGTYTTERATKLGILPAGYADGYPLVLGNEAVVRVGRAGDIAPVRGAVNMDQLIVDLTDVPSADVGTPVEVISNDVMAPNALHKLAKMASSNCYEMLCRLSERVPRRHVMTHQKVSGPTALDTQMIEIERK